MSLRVDNAEDRNDIAIDDKYDAIWKTLWKNPAHLEALVAHHEQQRIFRDTPNGFSALRGRNLWRVQEALPVRNVLPLRECLTQLRDE